jgi:hypothetical protein
MTRRRCSIGPGESWRAFTGKEKRNMAIFIFGIMLYKFGLEAFNGSIIALATNRYDYEAIRNKTKPRTFERVGLLSGLNQAFQCVGAILIAPMVRGFSTKTVLSAAVLVFGFFTAILLIMDASTGGTFVPAAFRKKHPENDFHYYGTYNTDAMIPVFCVAGVAYGMVELIRRVIPRDIVGGNIQKLRQMDALVHIFYEVSGTAGAFCTALALIPRLGNNYSFMVTPIFFALAAMVWYGLGDAGFQAQKHDVLSKQPIYIKAVIGAFYVFVESVWTGCKLTLSSRRFIWLLPGYAIALYGHRYLENAIAPAVARRYLGDSAWAQIMVGGSNTGELLGALFVFLFTNLITTPIPWLRLDSIMLLAVWYLPFWNPPSGHVSYAWIVAATFAPISFGWAAGDVSLAAYIQATLARVESRTRNVSALGAVMAFLYTTYIVTYALASPTLGAYIDRVYAQTGGAQNGGHIQGAMVYVAGVQYSVMALVIFSSTFVPSGSFSLNPKLLFDQRLDVELEQEKLDVEIGPTKQSSYPSRSSQSIQLAHPGRPVSPVSSVSPISVPEIRRPTTPD